MMELIDFGKHTSYVWSVVGLSLAVLLFNVISARRRLADRITRARRRIAMEETV